MKKKFLLLVEAARGLAAIEVFGYHLVEVFNLASEPKFAYILKPFSFGTQAVILFFVLSGISIHYSCMDKSLNTRKGVSRYLLARWVRLYPILLFALFLTSLFVVAGTITGIPAYESVFGADFAKSLVGSLVFVVDMRAHSGYLVPTPFSNPPLWSLSYEVVYYIIYPLFWLAARKAGNWNNVRRISLFEWCIYFGCHSLFPKPPHECAFPVCHLDGRCIAG